MAKSKDNQPPSNTSRRVLALTLALILGLAVNAGIFIGLSRSQTDRLQRYFEFGVMQRMSAIERSVENKELTMLALQNHLSSVQNREDFKAFTAPFLKQVSGIQALEWIPRVERLERAEYIQAARDDGYNSFSFVAMDSQGDRVRAPSKDTYYPVYFIEPYEGNEAALGFDLSSNAARQATITRAIETGLAQSTGRVNLIQDQTSQAGILTFFPIFKSSPQTMTIAQREKNIMGFALGVFVVPDLIDISIESFENDQIDIYVTDVTEVDTIETLHYHNTSTTYENYNKNYFTSAPEELHSVETLKIGTRTWQLTFVPTPIFISAYQTYVPYLFLAVGLFIMFILIAYYNAALARTITITNLVTERTQELQASKTEAEQLSNVAQQANKSKTEFLTNISHELRTPLNGVLGISNTLLKNRTANLSDSQLRGLHMIQKSGFRILDLINDILDLEKLESGNMSMNTRPVRVAGLSDYVEYTFKNLMEARIAHHEEPLDLHIYCSDGIPEFIESDRRLLEQSLNNLLQYAVAYTKHGSITFNIKVVESSLSFEITDSNKNISPEELSNVFNKFYKRSGVSKAYQDSGLGLSMARSLAQMMGGNIKAHKTEAGNSTFSMSYLFRLDDFDTIESFEKHFTKEQYRPFGQVKSKSPIQLQNSLARLKKTLSQSSSSGEPNAIEFDVEDLILKEEHTVLNGKTILICSGRESLRRDMIHTLSTFDLTLIECSSATNAIENLEDAHPDLIILDDNLADSSPTSLIDIFQILRQDGAQAYLVISDISEEKYRDDITLEVVESPLTGTLYLDALAGLLEQRQAARRVKRHILIADDETVGRELLRMILEKDYTLSYAANGREAVQLYFENKPDMVLMDIMMPEMDGTEALHEIVSNDPNHTPVIALTAKALKEEEEHILQSGFDGYISKPYQADKLGEMIDQLLKQSPSGQA